MLEKVVVDNLFMIFIDEHVQQYQPIISDISVDYKEQIVITNIKSGTQCFICKIFLKEYENLCKIWALKIHKNT